MKAVRSGEKSETPPTGPCLFCRDVTGSFTSIEHIFPESLGNVDHILPKGVVCDRCNNTILSGLDDALLAFEPIKMMRAIYGIPNKTGKLVAARFSNLRVELRQDGVVAVHAPGRRSAFRPTTQGFKLNHLGNSKMTEERCLTLARAFYKIGLELLGRDRGAEFALGPRFDELRQVVLGEVLGHGYLVIASKADLKREVSVHYQEMSVEGQLVTFFEVDLFGMRVTFDLERRALTLAMREEARRRGWNILEF